MTSPDIPASMKPKLTDHGFNRHSQFGEDGVIERIFALIGVRSKLCIEFGAWDGFHLSNTANLWTNGWKGVLIEGHSARFAELTKNVQQYQCTCIEAYVEPAGPQSLESLLAKNKISADVDLLSIDIDGDDYYILDGLDQLRPRVIICEYNPTIPAHIDLYAERGSNFGASVSALERVGRGKGYRLVAITDTNCFFVLDNEFAGFAGYETSIDQIRIERHLVYLMTSYSGRYVVSKGSPYGLGQPYRGRLIGAHESPSLQSPLAGYAATISGWLKRGIKLVFGKKH